MKHLFRVNTGLLPWLFPLVLLLVVVVVPLAPSPIVGVLVVVVSLGLGYGAVPWYYWHRQQRADRGHTAL